MAIFIMIKLTLLPLFIIIDTDFNYYKVNYYNYYTF